MGLTGVLRGGFLGFFKGGDPDYGGPICGVGFIMIAIAILGFITNSRMRLKAWRSGLFRRRESGIREIVIALGVTLFSLMLFLIVVPGFGHYRSHSTPIIEYIARYSLQSHILLMVIGLVVTAAGLMMPIKYSESEVQRWGPDWFVLGVGLIILGALIIIVPAMTWPSTSFARLFEPIGLILIAIGVTAIVIPKLLGRNPRPHVPPEYLCPTCNRPMTWIPQYQRWFCQYCQRYA